MSDKQFPCAKCDRTFKSQGALNGHQQAHSFWNYLGSLRPKEDREKERKEAHDRLVIAVIKHYSHNKQVDGKPHCDVCAVAREVINGPLMRDMAAWLDHELSAKKARAAQ